MSNLNSTGRIFVHKYGGSSLKDVATLHRVALQISEKAKKGNRIVAVVSAMGDTTDDLTTTAQSILPNNTIPAPREMDALLSTGEMVSSALLAMTLNSLGTPAVSLNGIQAGINTTSTHTSARIVSIDDSRLRRELDAGRVVIVAGFQGVDASKDITTLGRGGSDTTAVALAVVLGAERCEMCTDVEGIYTTDPRIEPNARKLSQIDVEEMMEMASLGAKMNPRAMELAAEKDMPVYVRSTFSDEQGTLIEKFPKNGTESMETGKTTIRAIPVERNIAKVRVAHVPDRPGIAAGILAPIMEAGISVDVIVQNTSGKKDTTDFTFTLSEADKIRAAELVQAQDFVSPGKVYTESGLAKVSIVGTGMQNTPGYASTMFETLAKANVNIDMITTSEIRITCVVAEERVNDAVRALHKAFSLHA